uniref:Transmembrane protein 174 n=1 Tax=Myotis myotis TaxID=51298 RepID=A0A7J7Y361_MYOMY|nr:transmembrane protein 174 [Myotis myotis]
MEQGSRPLEDFPVNVFSVTPYTPSTADIQVSDDDKAGATLLFSGVFLGLVGITFPITFHGATVVQYIPPPYGSQEPIGVNTAYLQPVVNPCCLTPPGVVAAATPSPPQYCTIYPSENSAFVDDQDYPAFADGGDDRSSPDAELLEETQRGGEDSAGFSPPPYEEIFSLPR